MTIHVQLPTYTLAHVRAPTSRQPVSTTESHVQASRVRDADVVGCQCAAACVGCTAHGDRDRDGGKFLCLPGAGMSEVAGLSLIAILQQR